MKLKFKIQQYQTDAVECTAGVFSGQPDQGLLEYKVEKGKVYVERGGRRIEMKGIFDDVDENTGYKNAPIVLSESDLLANIHSVQRERHLHLSSVLVKKLGACQLDIEMETGTGKTYVYIKTIFELNRRYGWTKFIVVVPSIAIREGVKKSFDITQAHFMELYGKKARYFIYNSDHLNQIDSFSQSADINVMIINTQAFNTSLKEGAKNKAARIIYDKRDEFGSRRPIDVIAANNPIVILDEPQKMGGAATQSALARFNPLFTLNYSATHKVSHNPVYVLDALDAFNQKLVKKIEVVGFELKNLKGTNSYIYLADIILSKNKPPRAQLEFEIQSKGGLIKRDYRNVVEGDDLHSLSGGMEQYRGYVVTDIFVDSKDSSRSRIVFSNGATLVLKEAQGDVSADDKARVMIRETIKAHLRKEQSLLMRGIKCLSLFFIDEVAKYRQYDDDGRQLLGRYGKLFEQEYAAAVKNVTDPVYKNYLDSITPRATHAGYFSIDKKGHAVDSEVKRGSDFSDDSSAYDLILKDKERLLSLDEPVRFIFSHSALSEGWDNPNVFQICSLRQSNSSARKRQEVGRGLRLCVNSDGVRQDSDAIPDEVHVVNKLTVVASEGYASFVADLQKDICQDLYERPTKANMQFFDGKDLELEDGSRHTITPDEANLIFYQIRKNGYIDDNFEVTNDFRKAYEEGALKRLDGSFGPMTDGVYKLLHGILNPNDVNKMIENGANVHVDENKLNDNFHKKQFKELWNLINHKYAYTVNFDSQQLIKDAIDAINRELNVTSLSYILKRGEQKEFATSDDIKSGAMMAVEESSTVKLDKGGVVSVKYDLLGKIGSAAKLTRKTVAEILRSIKPEKFNMYKANPEEFIRKVTRIILEKKATIIVEHVSYNRLEETYDSDIFTQEKHFGRKGKQVEKSVMDFVFPDSQTEGNFVDEMEKDTTVVVYAKLPKGFHIPTPVGNYSPDWAIALEKENVKHIYFVAETKGSLSSMELRAIENNKIECAKKLFCQLSTYNIKYGKITSFQDLMDNVMN